MHIQQSPWKIGGRKNRQSLVLMDSFEEKLFEKSSYKLCGKNYASKHINSRQKQFFIASEYYSIEIDRKKVEIMMKNAVKLKNQIFTSIKVFRKIPDNRKTR